MNDKTAHAPDRGAKTPGARSASSDPDRKDTPGGSNPPKGRGAPVRDVREEPAPNPNGDPRSKVMPHPTDKPITGA